MLKRDAKFVRTKGEIIKSGIWAFLASTKNPNGGASTLNKAVKWASVGGLSATLDAGLFGFLYPSIKSVVLTNFIVIPLVTALGYTLNHLWSFESTRRHKGAILRFVINLAFYFTLNSGLVWVGLQFGLHPSLAKLATIPIQAPINFFILNRWVFGHK